MGQAGDYQGLCAEYEEDIEEKNEKIERLEKALEWIEEWCKETPNGYLESKALLRLVQQALKKKNG